METGIKRTRDEMERDTTGDAVGYPDKIFAEQQTDKHRMQGVDQNTTNEQPEKRQRVDVNVNTDAGGESATKLKTETEATEKITTTQSTTQEIPQATTQPITQATTQAPIKATQATTQEKSQESTTMDLEQEVPAPKRRLTPSKQQREVKEKSIQVGDFVTDASFGTGTVTEIWSNPDVFGGHMCSVELSWQLAGGTPAVLYCDVSTLRKDAREKPRPVRSRRKSARQLENEKREAERREQLRLEEIEDAKFEAREKARKAELKLKKEEEKKRKLAIQEEKLQAEIEKEKNRTTPIGFIRIACRSCGTIATRNSFKDSKLELIRCPVCTTVQALDHRKKVVKPPPKPDCLKYSSRLWSPAQVSVFLAQVGAKHIEKYILQKRIDGLRLQELSYEIVRETLGMCDEPSIRHILETINYLKTAD